MKALIILLAVLAGVWLWRNGRDRVTRERGVQDKPKLAEPQDMVRCPVCALHLPRVDALAGPDGQLYCCAEHSRQAGS